MYQDKKYQLVKGLALILVASLILLVVSLSFAQGITDMDLFKSYFKSFKLLVLNFLPILIFLILAWGLTNRTWLSFFLASSLIIIGGMANRTKIIYRNDPLVMTDLGLITEAKMMSERYKLPINTRVILSIGLLVLLTILIKKFFDYKFPSKKSRLGIILGTIVLGIGLASTVYSNTRLYDSLGDMEIINRWIQSERHQAKGFIYPFVYSGRDLREEKPENYSEKRAKEKLASYDYKDIPEDKKVNIIGIMLEAYNDFSKFDGVNPQNGTYDFFHRLQDESIYGNLVTNIFAGGTVDTERAFLTGYQHQPKYRKMTNSFVWYFKDQGYKTEAMHPITGSFYNRMNVNENLGFENFNHGDNFYDDKALFDEEFLPSLIAGFEKSKSEGRPYFNFSVTYQNHGPYSTKAYHDIDYLERKPTYDEGLFNIANNYLYGVKDTGDRLEEFIGYFREEEEPVVIVLFGDHNPWLGEGNSVYKMLGIDLDLENPEGFKNYYETPFIIWGNDAAKERLGKDLRGEREEIGSLYLMAELFEALGYEGNPYMQYLVEMKKILPVQHHLFFKENGDYKKSLDSYKDQYREFVNTEFYYSRNMEKRDR